ncbi:unnamed protein product, partial [Vitis vinifera]|uniref:Complex III subunit VI n=1 Tax=Vitis vinifera TaxID=29760 RepID=D7SRB0_VITVI
MEETSVSVSVIVRNSSGWMGFALGQRRAPKPRLLQQALPGVRADEEPVDPKKYLEESCKPKCVRYLRAYEACENRVKEDETGHKHCTGQYFDYWSCVDKCVAPRLFTKLK